MLKTKFLNKERVIKELKRLAQRSKRKDKNILQIILFGSLVNDTYTSLSDADLLIILNKDKRRFIDRIPHYIPLFLDAPIEVEVFPYTEEEVEKIPLARNAKVNGIILA
jgi:predicted nucleotidyltransferase